MPLYEVMRDSCKRIKQNCDHVLQVVRKFNVPMSSAISLIKNPRLCGPNCVRSLDNFARLFFVMETVSCRESSSTPSCSRKLDRAVSTNLSSAMDDFRMEGLGGPKMRKLDSMLATTASSMYGMMSAMRLSSTCMFI